MKLRLSILFLLSVVSLLAQGITLSQTQVELAVAPGFNHAGVRVPLTYRANAAADLARLTINSDSTWVAGAVDATGAINLTFTTTGLTNRSYTGTLTITDGSVSSQLFVRATVASLNVVALLDDPTRSRTYGVQQDGVNYGSILIFDPLTLNPIANVTVGKKPADLAVSADGNELLVLCSADKSIVAVDLRTLTVRETLALPRYDDWDPTQTSGHVAYGSGNILYYVDGAWGPVLHVFDRSTRTVLQSIFIDGTVYAGAGNATWGFGAIALAPNKSALFGWSQYGWSAGSTGTTPAKFTIGADGRLTKATPTVTVNMNRDPLTAPAFVSADGKITFLKQYALDTGTLAAVRTFPSDIYAISPGAEIVSTQAAIFEYATGNKLYDLPASSQVQAMTSDYARLVYFDGTAHALKSVNLFDKVGATILKRNTSPANQAIVLPPTQLQWSPVPGVDRYRIYLGESSAAVTQAGSGSPLLLGEINGSTFPLATPLAAGKTYYWRVDVVGANEVVAGTVQSFTVSTIASDTATIDAATVRGHSNYSVPIAISSAAAGQAWSASATASWITFAATSGTTPATVTAQFNASALAVGVQQAEIKITGPDGTFSIPVRLQVDPLALTVIRSDPTNAMVYAVSEANPPALYSSTPTVGSQQAYLLELDSQAQTIRRVVTVGASVTDLAIHHGDNRIYVTNWQGGSLLAVNLNTFAVERSFSFSPFGNQNIGYPTNDVYRIAAGGAGRLVVEPEDQWITIQIFDTVAGAKLNTTFVREGGGFYDPTGRYYYHGDNNSSGAELHKFDVLADKFTELAHNRGGISSYYGSRTIVVSEDGGRIYWAGSLFKPDLTEEWAMNDIVYSTSRDGRYAFAETKIYDVSARKVIFGMPVATKVSAYNSTTSKLVLQQDARIGYYQLNASTALPAPVLALGTNGSTSLVLTWTSDTLQTGFTLQSRRAGAADWSDVSSAIASTVTSFTVPGLTAETAYEFRLKADSPAASSGWSNVVAATTLPAPPAIPSFNSLAALSPTSAQLQWTQAGDVDSFTIERTVSSSSTYAVVATVSGTTLSYTDSGLTTSTTYVYRLKATRRGADSSYTFTRSVTLQPPSVPVITRQQSNVNVLGGTPVTMSISASGNPAPTYQWYRNDAAIDGATGSSLTLNSPSAADAGTYKVIVSNSAGSVTSSSFTLTVTPSTTRMTNISVLADVGAATNLSVGFYVQGGPKTIFVRGLGPTLSAVGVSGVVVDPQITLYRHTGTGTVSLLVNNDWSTATNRAALLNATSRFTALPFISDPSRDAAIMPTINVDGLYSVQLVSNGGTPGTALVEMYDTDTGTPSRFINVSALNDVAPGKGLTAGFYLSGTSKKRLLIRGVGPGLGAVGVTGFLPDPQLIVHRIANVNLPIASNNDWGSAANAADAASASQQVAGLQLSAGSKDAVLLIDLDPGLYTAQVTSADGASGVALIEVYDVP